MLKWTGPAAIAALRVEADLRRVGDEPPMVSRHTSAHRFRVGFVKTVHKDRE
jgi:hypothetical protein